jgi:gas vesicle protein
MTPGLPSKHGLERKFKPWRKGKSQKKSASKSSLKNQLRSQQRFLSKLGEDNTEARATIEARIRDLEGEISGKHQVQHEKKNAAK